METVNIEKGSHVFIQAGAIEFYDGGNTIWVQSPEGGTIMRIKCMGEIVTEVCQTSPISHVDMIVPGDINFCLSKDANF